MADIHKRQMRSDRFVFTGFFCSSRRKKSFPKRWWTPWNVPGVLALVWCIQMSAGHLNWRNSSVMLLRGESIADVSLSRADVAAHHGKSSYEKCEINLIFLSPHSPSTLVPLLRRHYSVVEARRARLWWSWAAPCCGCEKQLAQQNAPPDELTSGKNCVRNVTFAVTDGPLTGRYRLCEWTRFDGEWNFNDIRQQADASADVQGQ